MIAAVIRSIAIGVMLAGFGLSATAEAASSSRGLMVPLKASEARDATVAEEVELYGSSHALVIGIDNYTNGWPRLSNAIADARAVADELRRKGFGVTLKTDLKASELEQVFKAFFIDKGAAPDARLFVWYAGHGHTENGEGFLIPADAPRPEAGRRFKFKALPMRRFGEYVRLAESKHAFAVFDSCFSGTVFDSARALPPAAVTRATTLPVRQFLTSGDAGQTVSDDGTFRKLFIRALRGEERADANGDGFVTASEMGLFLSDRLTNLTRSKQTPRYGKLRDMEWDRGDFVFALRRPAPSRPAPASTPATSPPPTATVDKETVFWQSIQGSNNIADFEDYLSRFPNGIFAGVAVRRVDTLRRQKSAAITPPAGPASGISLSRSWSGRYFYGKNNRQSVPFELDLKQEGTTITGRITEPRTFGNPTSNELYATIFGSIESDGSVRFTKTYDGTAGVSHSVEYVGLLQGSGERREISGTWRIKRTSGPFTMRPR
ncbi:MAG: caspase family protein [Alphaproteobacteria bacterium]|nr:caspase family protein [Alphaproteobacteria bacterium]